MGQPFPGNEDPRVHGQAGKPCSCQGAATRQGELGIPSRAGAVALVHAPCPSLVKDKQGKAFFAFAGLETS